MPESSANRVLHSAFVAAVVMLSGCAVGPDFKRPPAPNTERYTRDPLPAETVLTKVDGGNVQHFVAAGDIKADWWKAFHNVALDALVDEALRANPNLKSLQAALRVAQENLAAQRGVLFPTAEIDANSTRAKTAGEISPVLNNGQSLYTLHTAQLQIGYTFDLFGTNRRTIEAAAAQADSQRYQLEAARITLINNVVAAVVQLAALEDQLAAQQALVRLQSEQLDILRTQANLGEIAEAGAIAQETALAQAREQIPILRKQIAQQLDLVAALTGHLPSEQLAKDIALASISLPAELPLSLPSRLTEQRPDIRAAEADLHAASAQVGVATAAMFPQITLAANTGSSATRIADMFKAGGGFWALTGGLVQPVFEGGALLHKKRAAEAAFEQSAEQYRSVVVGAFQNVADTLEALRQDGDVLQAAVSAENKAQESAAIAKRQLEIGDISPLALIISEQAYQQTVQNRIAAQAARYTDTASLFQALGGGWWNVREAN